MSFNRPVMKTCQPPHRETVLEVSWSSFSEEALAVFATKNIRVLELPMLAPDQKLFDYRGG